MRAKSPDAQNPTAVADAKLQKGRKENLSSAIDKGVIDDQKSYNKQYRQDKGEGFISHIEWDIAQADGKNQPEGDAIHALAAALHPGARGKEELDADQQATKILAQNAKPAKK